MKEVTLSKQTESKLKPTQAVPWNARQASATHHWLLPLPFPFLSHGKGCSSWFGKLSFLEVHMAEATQVIPFLCWKWKTLITTSSCVLPPQQTGFSHLFLYRGMTALLSTLFLKMLLPWFWCKCLGHASLTQNRCQVSCTLGEPETHGELCPATKRSLSLTVLCVNSLGKSIWKTYLEEPRVIVFA